MDLSTKSLALSLEQSGQPTTPCLHLPPMVAEDRSIQTVPPPLRPLSSLISGAMPLLQSDTRYLHLKLPFAHMSFDNPNVLSLDDALLAQQSCALWCIHYQFLHHNQSRYDDHNRDVGSE